jgi:hypothetical protein
MAIPHEDWDYALKYRSVTVSSLRHVLKNRRLRGCRVFANPITGALLVTRRGTQIGYIAVSRVDAHFEPF